jgi:hypothetical protein
LKRGRRPGWRGVICRIYCAVPVHRRRVFFVITDGDRTRFPVGEAPVLNLHAPEETIVVSDQYIFKSFVSANSFLIAHF